MAERPGLPEYSVLRMLVVIWGLGAATFQGGLETRL
jgi:hypothetical protein